jgi:hypothetical protein
MKNSRNNQQYALIVSFFIPLIIVPWLRFCTLTEVFLPWLRFLYPDWGFSVLFPQL